jgi:hypothetical protein
MSNTIVTLATDTRVRINTPRHPDFNRAGVIVAVHYADTDSPSYLVQVDGQSVYTPFGASELALLPAPTPAPMLADVDWPRFTAEAEALAAEIYAEWHPINRISRADAAMCAAAQVQERYEAELATVAARAEAEALALAAEKRAASVARAVVKAEWHLAGGVQIRRAGCGAWLVPSSKGNAMIYLVAADFTSCTCKAGETATPCWHVEAARTVAAQQPEPTPPAAPLAFDPRRVLERVQTHRAALAA